jgi:OOP family OmpA-OmpF porin
VATRRRSPWSATPTPRVSEVQQAKLSERRAKAVADALVGAGVQATTLAVDWKGESEPAVATGDGVKEPLNRRSTISINF